MRKLGLSATLRTTALAVVLLFAFCLVAGADEGSITLNFSDRMRISERSNLLRTENGRYVGLTNRQMIAYISQYEPLHFMGRTLIYEETLRDLSEVGRPVDASVEESVHTDSRMAFTGSVAVPRYLGIPTLPAGLVRAGDSWEAPAQLRIDLPEPSEPLLLDVHVEYQYAGTELFAGERVHRIEAAFATRYPPRPDPDADPDIPVILREDVRRVSGRHVLTILVPDNSAAPLFIRDELEESYDMATGNQTVLRGHNLVFVHGLSADAQRELAREIQGEIERTQTSEITVEQTDTGTRITVQNLRFVADQAVLLAGEEARLQQIASILQPLEGVRFLVVGHTADVGSEQSQLALSRERARVVVAGLVDQGINRELFDMEGRGGRQPVGDNSTDSGRALNRRVEIYVLEE